MSFLTPLYLAGAALIALPIVLHLLRRDVAPPVPFTAVRLLRKTAVDRSRRHRLRDLLLLAARVAALLLLAASFARPYRAGAAATTRTTVIAIDRSFSMGSPALLDRARTLARDAIDAAAGDRLAVIGFDDRADVLAAPGPAADARAAVAEVQAGFGGTRYAAALDKAAELLANETSGRVVLIGDLQRSGFDLAGAVLPEGVELTVRDAGAPPPNLAVSRLAGDPARRRAVATVRNSARSARTTDIRLSAGGGAPAVKRVTVPPGDAADVAFDIPADAASLHAAIDDGEGLAADNERFAIVERRSVPRVLIATGGPASQTGFYLSRALEAQDDDGPEFIAQAVTGGALSTMTPAQVQDYAVIAILATHGLDRRAGDLLRAHLQRGGGIFIAAGPDVDAAVLSTLLDWRPPLAPRDGRQAGVMAVTDLRHPVFKPFDAVAANFGQVAFDRTWRIDDGDAWRVAARFTTGAPALVERSGPGRVLLFTSDVDRRWNDLPLHPAFVPFTQEVARYLGARPAPPSAYLVADVPAGTAPRPGFAQIAGRTVAVNVDARESALDRVTPAEFQQLVARSGADTLPKAQRLARESEGLQNYWRYGLMLLLATLVVEAFVGSR
ncbi:MAG TPA: BatA and WFA domain-containing protein [Vicinamibacterales bacterium]|nr:BatA and WFA domain-containing protein [Vicinamibacterales bacterium]